MLDIEELIAQHPSGLILIIRPLLESNPSRSRKGASRCDAAGGAFCSGDPITLLWT